LTLFKRSDEGGLCDALAGAFVMTMAGDHLSYFLSTFSLSGKMTPFVARIPGDGGVAKAIPPMTSALRDSAHMLNPENNPKWTPTPPAFQNFESVRTRGAKSVSI